MDWIEQLERLAALKSQGLLTEEDSDPLTGTNRKLVMTDGTLENAVFEYLSDLKQHISSSL